ncbi:hypothetical protein [Flavobacterium sp.]|uniref:hypothetical protein n=1 Tax=Flavobacterium sp. TaxID=239 RepID=UPI0039E43C51
MTYFVNNVQENVYTLAYEGDLLISKTSQVDSYNAREEFEYENGYLKFRKKFYFDEGNYIPYITTQYTFEGGNISEALESFTYANKSPYSLHQAYTHDQKNNPFKNMNKYFNLIYFDQAIDGLNTNNLIGNEYYTVGELGAPINIVCEINYNSEDFPTMIKRRYAHSETPITITTIEYQ